MYDTFIIGHISRDIIRTLTEESREEIGGAVVAASYAASGSGHHIGILTKTLLEDKGLLNSIFNVPRDDVYHVLSNETTSIENFYNTPERETRILTAKGIADPYTIQDIPEGVEAKVYHLAGLINGDYSPDLIPYLSKKGKVAVDISGFMRTAMADRSLVRVDWEEKKKYLPYITYFKVDAAEAEVMTGSKDRYEAASIIKSWGCEEVLLTHNSEVLVFDGHNYYTCPYKARSLVGRTGRGDTTFSAYITERIHKGPKEAVNYAAALVSIKMETPGPFTGNREDVMDYMDEFY